LSVVFALLIIVFVWAFYFESCDNCPPLTDGRTTHHYSCQELEEELDKVIIDSNNPPGRFIIIGYEGVVGGTLTGIDSPGFDKYSGFYEHFLTFKGKTKEGELLLITKTDQKLPYNIGEFYKFDLANRRKYGYLSGSFIDNNLNKLIPVICE